VHPLEPLAHAQLALARPHRRDVVGADLLGQAETRAAVEAPRDPRDEQRQRAVLLDGGRRPRRGVEVLLDPLKCSAGPVRS
jgi:hypothetical protein